MQDAALEKIEKILQTIYWCLYVVLVYMRPYSGFTLLSGIYSPPIQGLCAKGTKNVFPKIQGYKHENLQKWDRICYNI